MDNSLFCATMGSQPLFRKIREAVTSECGVAPAEIVWGRLVDSQDPSSGKIGGPNVGAAISRARSGSWREPVAYRNLAVEGAMFRAVANERRRKPVARRSVAASGPAEGRARHPLLRSTAARLLHAPEADLDENAGGLSSGLDSLRAVELEHAIDSLLRAEVPLSLLLSDISFAALAEKSSTPPRRAVDVQVQFLAIMRRPSRSARCGRFTSSSRRAPPIIYISPSEMTGPLDEATLQASFEDVLERHATLHSVYEVENGELVVSTRPAIRSTDGFGRRRHRLARRSYKTNGSRSGNAFRPRKRPGAQSAPIQRP